MQPRNSGAGLFFYPDLQDRTLRLAKSRVFVGLSAGKLGVNTEERDGRRCLLCKIRILYN
nr:MAG TPA: hypothetical protein [Caudoviricetes sp.]